MDSCSSSPSHSFKERHRSHHGDLPRQTSIPRALERAKSPAGRAASESRDACVETRDPTRRSYGDFGVEKTRGDGVFSSQDKSRSSPRRPPGFERQRDSIYEKNRFATSCGVSRNFETEFGETGERPENRRSSYGELAHKQEMLEGLSRSPLPFERESTGCKTPSMQGYDRGGDGKCKGSTSPEVDKETSKSSVSGKASMKNESKEAFVVSSKGAAGLPSLRKDTITDKDCALNSPVKKEASERARRSPSWKDSAREVHEHDDVDTASTKIKPSKIRDLDKLKEQEFSSHETEARAWNKGLLSRLREDMLESELLHEFKSLHEDASRDSPVSFLHVSKRARSERDKGRRDEHAGKSIARYSQWNEFAKADLHQESSINLLEHDSFVKRGIEDSKESIVTQEAKENLETSARSVDAGLVHASEKLSDNLENKCVPPINGGSSDIEEGELEPESDAMTAPGFVGESGSRAIKEEEIKRETCSALIMEPTGKELGEGECLVGIREEDELMINGNEVCQHGDDDNNNGSAQKKALPDTDKEEAQSRPIKTESVDMNVEAKSLETSTNNILELGNNSTAGVLVDLLGAKGEMNSLNKSSSADLNMEPRKELTLSLFMNSNQTAGESSQSKGNDDTKVSNGKHIVKPQSSCAGFEEGSSQLSGHKQKKLKLESLRLSLALPGSSNVAGVPDGLPFANPAEPSRSFQSNQTQTNTHKFLQSQTYTNSDGFTSSFSFSQSESFIHNPSCSLNCTSFENQELSCGGTRQLSHGTELMSNRSWPALSGNEHGMHTLTSVSHDKSKNRRGIPLYQRVLQNGSMHQGFPSVTGSNRSSGSNHFSQKSYNHGQWLREAPKLLDSSSQDLDGSVRQATTHKDVMESVRQQKAWFASRQQTMSAEPHSVPTAAHDNDKPEDLPSSNVKGVAATDKEKDIAVGDGRFLSEKIGLREITIDPITLMARKLQELPDSFLEGLKDIAKGVLSNFEKREEFLALQENIRKRNDLTEDSLLRAHRTQLEILAALKTGCQSFVQEGSKTLTYKVLIEIFLETRCRNVACLQPLLAYECGCRVCLKKSGYCRDCMCVVCFKFDLDDSTCRWLGCDVCWHWCHTDCALRMSYIAPTQTDKSMNVTKEMQYQCVVCDRKSELYGFVKDVFQNCAEKWGAEALAKELDCVRRIFHGSDNMRGKQLCWKAEQMLQKLETKEDATEVCRSMLRYLNEGNAELDGACGPIKRSSSFKATTEILGRMSDSAREIIPKALASGVSKLMDNDNARVVLQKLDRTTEEKRTETSELQYDRSRIRAEIEEMESDIRIKQAEANMFQIRANEAQREAGGLERIISVKKEETDKEYAVKYAKLELSETEEKHQKRFEELRALENAQQDFQKMKVRMEAEIKELMLKMEMAKRQFI